MSNQNRKFEGVWIEKEVWVSKSLTLQEKCFFVEIKSLDNKDGCFATNEYFSDFFQISKRRCISVINSLDEKGLINKKLIYKKGTKQVEKRVLRVSNTWRKKLHHPSEESFTTPHEENDMTPVKEVSPPSCQNVHDPGEGMFTDNSTSNNTSNSTIEREHAHARKTEKDIVDQIAEKTITDDLIEDAIEKAQKIISAQSDRPPHENDFPKSDSDLKKIVGVPTPEQASEMMIEYYMGEGWGTWERWLYAAGAKPEEVDMKSICIGWTDKNCDNPLILRNWKKESRKNLFNWIKTELRSNRQHQAKIKSLNKGNTNERLKVGAFGNQPQREIVVSKVPV